jgi:hypothetical protein
MKSGQIPKKAPEEIALYQSPPMHASSVNLPQKDVYIKQKPPSAVFVKLLKKF